MDVAMGRRRRGQRRTEAIETEDDVAEGPSRAARACGGWVGAGLRFRKGARSEEDAGRLLVGW